MKGFFTVYLLLTADGKFSCTDRLLTGLRATACAQEFWFRISRFMREISNQEISLAGNQHDENVSTMNSFHKHGQHHIKEAKERFSSDFLIVVSYKYISLEFILH